MVAKQVWQLIILLSSGDFHLAAGWKVECYHYVTVLLQHEKLC